VSERHKARPRRPLAPQLLGSLVHSHSHLPSLSPSLFVRVFARSAQCSRQTGHRRGLVRHESRSPAAPPPESAAAGCGRSGSCRHNGYYPRRCPLGESLCHALPLPPALRTAPALCSLLSSLALARPTRTSGPTLAADRHSAQPTVGGRRARGRWKKRRRWPWEWRRPWPQGKGKGARLHDRHHMGTRHHDPLCAPITHTNTHARPSLGRGCPPPPHPHPSHPARGARPARTEAGMMMAAPMRANSRRPDIGTHGRATASVVARTHTNA